MISPDRVEEQLFFVINTQIISLQSLAERSNTETHRFGRHGAISTDGVERSGREADRETHIAA
jgi:hypothetical protein